MGIAELLEIGEDGLRLRSPRPLDVDEDVQVHLTLPALSGHAARRCTLEARVVWRTGPLCGLLFTDAERARPRVLALLQRETASRSA
jgi:hypothetical protein